MLLHAQITKRRLRCLNREYSLHSFSRCSRCRPTAPSADRVRSYPQALISHQSSTMIQRSAALSSSYPSSSSSSLLRRSALPGRRRLPAVRGAAASALADGGGANRHRRDVGAAAMMMPRHHSSAAPRRPPLREQRDRPRDVDDVVDRAVAVVDDEPDYASLGPTSRLNLFTAINSAMRCALRTDDTAIVFGEDVGFGGVFRCSQDLLGEFGKDRVFNTPLSENGIAVSECVDVCFSIVRTGVFGVAEIVELGSRVRCIVRSRMMMVLGEGGGVKRWSESPRCDRATNERTNELSICTVSTQCTVITFSS